MPEQPVAPILTRVEQQPHLRLLIPLVVACALFMEMLDSTILATAVPDIALSLATSPLSLSLAVTSYLLSLAMLIPISGWVADRFGARRVFCGAIILFTVGSMLCGIADSLEFLVATRIVQGMGGAMMTPVGRLILLRSFPKDQLVNALSYMAMPALIGPTVGPLLGGWLTSAFSWRWIFYINLPIGLVGIVLALRYLEDFRQPRPPAFDFKGFFILALGLVLLEGAIEFLGRGVVSGLVEAGLFGAAFLILALYALYARGHPAPALDLGFFRMRCFSIAVIVGSLARIGLGALPFLLPLMLQVGFGRTALGSGALTFVSGLGAVAMKSVAPMILRRMSFRVLLVANGLLVGAGAAGLATISAVTPDWVILVYLLTLGFFRSLQFTMINALSFADLTPDLMSRGTSITAVAQQLSFSLGVGLAAAALSIAAVGRDGPSIADFDGVLIGVGGVIALSGLCFLCLKPGDGAGLSAGRTGP